MNGELDHFTKVYDSDSLTFQVPVVWTYVERHLADQMEEKAGVRNLYEYVGNHCKSKDSVSLLGLGSGPCGNELNGILPFLKGKKVQLAAIDINRDLLDYANRKALEKGVEFKGIVADMNTISLREDAYDVIVAYSALHHFMELDHIAAEINKALKPDGVFLTVDIPTRNGYLMWDDTLEIVRAIWKILPDEYKMDHTGGRRPFLAKEYMNVDYSESSFECINSEAILPSLRMHLTEVAYVPVYSLMRRFFDTKFGPNYNMGNPLDRSIYEFIKNLDQYYLDNNILKPETFFGAYRKRGH